MKQKDALQNYRNACNDIVSVFARKQGLTFDFWVADEIGGVACFGDIYFFSLQDMLYDIEGRRKKGLILQWIEDAVEANEKEPDIEFASYREYCLIEDFKNGKIKEDKKFRSDNLDEIRKHIESL
jgi:hypothetical protein